MPISTGTTTGSTASTKSGTAGGKASTSATGAGGMFGGTNTKSPSTGGGGGQSKSSPTSTGGGKMGAGSSQTGGVKGSANGNTASKAGATSMGANNQSTSKAGTAPSRSISSPKASITPSKSATPSKSSTPGKMGPSSTQTGGVASTAKAPSAKVSDPMRNAGPDGPFGAPGYSGPYNAANNTYGRANPPGQTVNTAGKGSMPGKMGPSSTQTGGVGQSVNTAEKGDFQGHGQRSVGVKTNFGGLAPPGGILGKTAQINSAMNRGQQVNRQAKSNTPGKMGPSSTQTGAVGQTVNAAMKTDLGSPKVARPNMGGILGNTAQINSAVNPAQQVNRVSKSDMEQSVNRAAKTDKLPAAPTNADLAREIGNVINAAKHGISSAIDKIGSIFTGPAEQTVNRAPKGSLPPSVVGADINLNRAMSPYMSGDIAMQNAIGQPNRALDYGEKFSTSLIGSGLSTALDATKAGRAAGTPAKTTDRVAPAGGLTRGLTAPGGMPAPTGEESITPQSPQRLGSPLDQARQAAFNKLAQARGQLPPGASIVPASLATNMDPATAQMVNPGLGVVKFSNLANPLAAAAAGLAGNDYTTPGLAGYGNIGGVPVGTLGNRGVVASGRAAGPAGSISPSQQGDMVAPSQDYDGLANQSPSQDDSLPQNLRELSNRFQYEKDQLKQGVRDLPGRIWDAIVNGDIRADTPPPNRDGGGSIGERDAPSNRSARSSDFDALLMAYLRSLQSQQGILGNQNQMDLVFSTFV